MELQKLNKLAGILAIVGAVIFPIAFWIVASVMVGEMSINWATGDVGGIPTSRPAIAWVFDIFAVASLGVFIYALIQSKKEGLKTTGHILGIIATAYFVISPIFPGTVAMILLIIAAVQLMRLAKIAPPADDFTQVE